VCVFSFRYLFGEFSKFQHFWKCTPQMCTPGSPSFQIYKYATVPLPPPPTDTHWTTHNWPSLISTTIIIIIISISALLTCQACSHHVDSWVVDRVTPQRLSVSHCLGSWAMFPHTVTCTCRRHIHTIYSSYLPSRLVATYHVVSYAYKTLCYNFMLSVAFMLILFCLNF